MERNSVHPNIIVTVLTFWIITLLSQPRLVAATEPNELPADGPRKVIMTISPAPEPIPSLKYELLPKFQDQTPGNAALFYCYAYYNLSENDEYEYKFELLDKLSEFLETPPEKLPKKEVHDFLDAYKYTLDYLKLAASRQRCDWESPLHNQSLRSESRSIPYSSFSRFARILALQARLQIVEAKYDAAISTFQQGLAIARHFGEGPLLDLNEDGFIFFHFIIQQLEEFVQAPSSPNLYWALTSLPRPFINAHNLLRYERNYLFTKYPQLQNLENKILTSSQAKKLWSDIWISCVRNYMFDDEETAFKFSSLIYPIAKESLIAKGRTKKEVEALPVEQVVLIYHLNNCLITRDNIYKWLELPYPQASKNIKKILNDLKKRGRYDVNPLLELLDSSLVLYDIEQYPYGKALFERKIAILRCVEVLRMYAARHEGKLPKSLKDVKGVAVPIDPLWDREFTYRLEGDKAVIESLAPSDKEYGLIYEITVRK